MILLFLIVPLIEIVVFSFLRVKSKTHLTGEIIYHSFFQSVISYLFLLLFFYQTFFSKFYLLLIVLFMMLIFALLYFLKDNDLSFTISGVLKLEGIKNNILIVFVTIYPLYVFLTIFRFNNWILQILLSLVLTFAIFVLSILLRKTMDNLYQNIKNKIIESDLGKYILAWSLFGFLLIFNIFFQLPLNPIKNSLNLSNNAPYFRFDGLPTDINNSYKQNLDFKLLLTDNDGRSIYDYIVYDNHLYLTQDNVIYKYDIATSNMVKKYYISGKLSNDYFNEILFVSADNLYVYCEYGLYKVTDENLITIEDINSNNSRRILTNEGDTLFLRTIDEDNYNLYLLTDDTLTMEESINLSISEYDQILTISKTLFLKKGDDYILYEDNSKIFKGIDSNRLYYNSEYQVIQYLKDNCIYYNDGKDNIKAIEYIGRMLEEIEVVGDVTVIREGTDFDNTRLILLNYDISNINTYNHLDFDRFFKLNDYNVSYVANYRFSNNNIQFLQVEANPDKTNILIYNLERKDVDIRLPFYSHYSFFSMIVILIAMIIPITDDIKYLSYLDFNSVTNKD